MENGRSPEKLVLYENSPSHRKSFTMWKEVERRITFGIGIDACTEAMIQSEKQRWREVLKTMLACIKYLASQNL